MKRRLTLLTSALLAFATSAHAYRGPLDEPPSFTDEGRKYIGGTFSFVSSSGTIEFDGEKADLNDSSTYGGAFNFGYFVTQGLMLGGTVGFETRTTSGEDSDFGESFENSTTTGLIEVFPRYYIPLSDAKQAFLFLLGSLGYASVSNSQTFEGDETDSSTSGFTFSVGAGLAALVGGPERGAIVDLSLRLRKSFLSPDDADDFSGDVSFDTTDISVGVGIGVFF